MDKAAVTLALIQLHNLLRSINQPWFVIGTTSLMLAGYDVEPNDIDILTDKVTAFAIAVLLGPHKVPVELKDNGKFRSAFSRYIIEGVSVELMGDLQVSTATGWVNVLPLITEVTPVKLEGLAFNLPSKADQVKIYTLFGRKKDNRALGLLRHQ